MPAWRPAEDVCRWDAKQFSLTMEMGPVAPSGITGGVGSPAPHARSWPPGEGGPALERSEACSPRGEAACALSLCSPGVGAVASGMEAVWTPTLGLPNPSRREPGEQMPLV
ncbi:MAG TPA: hypothetical protein VMK12_19260, partial [Anaeromyxobacteraceae bacterium]|nr:hypothetical protein [Anaeromyxobacteraceae bacterium]